MKINIISRDKEITFSSLSIGSWFLWGQEYMIKTSDTEAFSAFSHKINTIDFDLKVIKVNYDEPTNAIMFKDLSLGSYFNFEGDTFLKISDKMFVHGQYIHSDQFIIPVYFVPTLEKA